MKNFGGIKTRYLLDGTNIIAQEVTNGDSLDYIYFFYDASGSPVGMNYLGNNYYYKKNLQGDIIEIWGTEDGTDNHTFRRLVEYTYDAWGNILQMNDTTDGWFKVGTANPFRYRGYYYDNESGFYYLQSRYYDPATGRFLNADMMEYIGLSGTTLGYNAFLYCENGAIARIDYTGYYWHQNYKGFELTKNGFNVDENKRFLSRAFCLSYANDFLRKHGRWVLWRFCRVYSGMNSTRIAMELWFHALAYYLGSYMKTVLSYFKKSSAKLDSIIDSARKINVNSDDNRVAYFKLVWYNGNRIVKICWMLPIPLSLKLAIR